MTAKYADPFVFDWHIHQKDLVPQGTIDFDRGKGTYSLKGKQTKPYGGEFKGDQEIEVIATYTLPKK